MARTKKKKLINAILIILGVAVIALIVFLVMFSEALRRVDTNDPAALGNTGGNINNEGLFCQDGDTVYFSNTLDNNFIYSMDLDGSNQKLVLGMSAKYINSAGKYLYYNQIDTSTDLVYGFTGNVHGIYRLEKGTRNTTMGFDRTVAGAAILIGNYVYYQHYDNDNGMTLYRSSVNGTDKGEVLHEIVNPCCVINGNIFYPDQKNGFNLNMFDTTNLTASPFLNIRMYNPVYSDGYIYYIGIGDNYPLCRYNISNRSVEQLTEDRVDCFNILGNVIFYQRNAADTPAIIRMAADGSSPALVALGNYTNINMTSTYTYFHSYGDPMDMFRVSTTGNPNPEAFVPIIEEKKPNKFSFKKD